MGKYHPTKNKNMFPLCSAKKNSLSQNLLQKLKVLNVYEINIYQHLPTYLPHFIHRSNNCKMPKIFYDPIK